MSKKIHPAAANPNSIQINPGGDEEPPAPSVLTVWKRSSMSFQGTDGFTVFDNRGRLVFRVDNYTRKSWSVGGGGLLLMDGSGKALLTLKPQVCISIDRFPFFFLFIWVNLGIRVDIIRLQQVVRLSLRIQQQWNAYRGEGNEACSTAFTMRRPTSSLIHGGSTSGPPCEAQIFLGEEESSSCRRRRKPDFKCEGSFRRRNCKIISSSVEESEGEDGSGGGRVVVANISRKRINTTLLLNDDVFTLTVQPGFDISLVMAFVIVLDRISSNNYAPLLCSSYA
ncbi:hypothetical protein M9H77_22201 [Catharanthus roseus]|uniref:Uncharacterized protein n=1 Tax=Catharanthus roseus TaxID=4058 RepID=A0ACC0API3_CATRO|nr:hypothetical protein M9H77_22201 [Catharanthus roseus]